VETAPKHPPPRSSSHEVLTGEAGDPFRDLVIRDLKYRYDDRITPEERAYLRSPEVLQEWLDTLKHLRREMQAQFAQRKAAANQFQKECFERGYEGKRAWFEYKADYDEWRARGNRYIAMISTRQDEAKRLIRERRQRANQHSYEGLLVWLLGKRRGRG